MNKTTIDNIKAAMYGCAAATAFWASDYSWHQVKTSQGRSVTEYGFMNRIFDKIRTATLYEGKRLHGIGISLYPVHLDELGSIMATSIMHREMLKTNTFSLRVSSLELKFIQLLQPVEKYVDIYLSECTDKEFQCRRRDLLVIVKPEYQKFIGVSFKHTLYDKDLVETIESKKEREYRKVFGH